jgi:DNA-directed RNA polymerase alpha subunit
MGITPYGARLLIERALQKLTLKRKGETVRKELSKLRDLSVKVEENPLLTSLDELDFSVRCLNCFHSVGIYYIWQLVQKKESDLQKIRGFGRKSLAETVRIISKLDLYLGTKWPEEIIKQFEQKTEKPVLRSRFKI